MKIGPVSDGKDGDRASDVLRDTFSAEWIMAPFPGSPVVDEIEISIPECDLSVSSVRHPDVALAVIEKQNPVILGVSLGPGFFRQARTINDENRVIER